MIADMIEGVVVTNGLLIAAALADAPGIAHDAQLLRLGLEREL